jgi:hypothetical protein
MLNPHPKKGDKVWKVDVSADFMFVPREVVFLEFSRGMVWYVNENGGKWGWYDSQFFHTEAETLEECALLEREAAGEITERIQKERDEFRARVEKYKLVRIP